MAQHLRQSVSSPLHVSCLVEGEGGTWFLFMKAWFFICNVQRNNGPRYPFRKPNGS